MNHTEARSLPLSTAIRSTEDVDQAVRLVRDRASRFGFARLEANLMASAASELGTNILLHAEHGRMRVDEVANGRGLEITFADEGPGIEDLERAKVEGYSSRRDGLGLGLTAAARAVDRFEIASAPGRGTVATLRHYLPPPDGRFELGVVTLGDPTYACNGDVVHGRSVQGDKQLLAVIDGAGQGQLARDPALCAREALESSCATAPSELARCAHDAVLALGAERGFVMSLLLADRDELRLVTVGDVACRVFDAADGSEPVEFAEMPGMLGTTQAVKLTEQRARIPPSIETLIVVLASDGVSPRFGGVGRSIVDHPLCVAHTLMRDFRNAHGDATVAVLKIRR